MASMKLLLGALVLAVALMAGADAQTQNAAAQCAGQIQQIIKTCTTSQQISDANFFWFASNGTSKNGQAPADENAFRDQICQVELQIGQCVLQQAAPLFNTSVCQGAPQVAQSVDSLFFTYDMKCAHPCRNTLIPDMNKCYTDAGLSTDLFLGNRTGGHVIGSTEADTTKFCGAKDGLLGCLKPLVDACPESLQILSTQQFHLPSYTQVINILCTHPNVYVQGLLCFGEATPQVEACVKTNSQSFIQTTINAQQQNWTEERFIQETCSINVQQIKCDLEAWAAKKHEACVDAVIGLRREMECKLLPPDCTNADKYSTECNAQKYLSGSRDNFGQGGSGGGAGGDGGATSHFLSSAVLVAALGVASLL